MVAIPDEGLYSAQAASLASGSWRSPLAATDIDPEGRFDVLFSEAVVGDERIPYSRHPLYPLILAGFYRLGGVTGLILPSVIATWVAAVTGARLALRLGPRLAIPTLWTIGIASPLLHYGLLVLGHSLAAALAGVLGLALVRDTERPRWTAVCLALVSAVAVVLVRTEGLILVAACAGALAITAVRIAPKPAVIWRRALIAAALLAAAGTTAFVEGRIAGQLASKSSAAATGIDRSPDFLDAAWASLFRPWHGSILGSQSSAAIIALSLPLAALALRAAPRRRALALGLLGLGVAAAVIRVLGPPTLINGLFAAFPALSAGLVLIRRSAVSSFAGRLCALTPLIATPVLLATMYGDGGSKQWGGRFFALLLPFVVPLAIAGLAHGARLLPQREQIPAGVALGVVSLALAILSLRAILDVHHEHERVIDATIEMADRMPDGAQTLIVVAPLRGDGASRMFWKQSVEQRPMLSLRGLPALPYVVNRAQSSGYREVLLVVDRPDVVELVMDPVFDRIGWAVHEERDIPGARWELLSIGEAGTVAGA